MIVLNGTSFPVGVTSLQRGEKREYKYQVVTESGRRVSELLARYRTYTVALGSMKQADYDALYAAVSAGEEAMDITLPDGQEDITLRAQIELGQDALMFIERDGTRRWDGAVLEVTGIEPLEAAV